MSQKIKILVVDDSITYRQILSKVVESLEGTELVGTALSGKTALMKIPSLEPHLVFLDVMMPEMDGIETLQRIKKEHPEIQVVMVSAFDMENAKATLRSLEDGALDFIPKPISKSVEDGIDQLVTSLKPLVEIVRQKIFPPDKKEAETAPAVLGPKRDFVKPEKPFDCILIGVSTGGPNALHKLLDNIKTKLEQPVFIVQHMPPMFTQSLAERLNTVSSMEVVEASDGQIPEPGFVYIAPGGKHMLIRGKSDGSLQISVTDTPPVNHCKPAVDVLFRSIAGIKGLHPLSIIMTGMGRDGTDGIKSLKRHGTYCLIQDEASSVVWGMPGSVFEANCADEILPLDDLASRIVQLTS